ncbi:MAG: S1 RNA-binding domain-containing protein, partial [Syntrophobacteraceae bacterium]
GRDPRKEFVSFSFAPGIDKITDLEIGMKLPGIVTNVTAFGAFVDVGVHRDGLVHISELSDNFVQDPRQVVRVHQHVSVTVLEVDVDRGRISFSMKSSSAPAKGKSKAETQAPAVSRKEKRPAPEKRGAFNNPFEKALKRT